MVQCHTCRRAAAARPRVARRSWHLSVTALANISARSNLTMADAPCLSFSNLKAHITDSDLFQIASLQRQINHHVPACNTRSLRKVSILAVPNAGESKQGERAKDLLSLPLCTTQMVRAGTAHLLPSRRAWTHCRASRLRSSSSVEASTLEVLSAPDRLTTGSACLSCTATDGCAPTPSNLSRWLLECH